jgi:hypothetical protein
MALEKETEVKIDGRVECHYPLWIFVDCPQAVLLTVKERADVLWGLRIGQVAVVEAGVC